MARVLRRRQQAAAESSGKRSNSFLRHSVCYSGEYSDFSADLDDGGFGEAMSNMNDNWETKSTYSLETRSVSGYDTWSSTASSGGPGLYTKQRRPPNRSDLILPIDYRCDDGRFWLSTHNCQVPTPTSQNLELEQQIRIFGADWLINCLEDWNSQFLICRSIFQKRRILRTWGWGLTIQAG